MDIKKLPTVEDIQREIDNRPLEKSLLEFTKWYFKEILKKTFIVNWHHVKLCEILEKIHHGELIHVIINMPPRYTKTELVVKAFIAWSLAKNSMCKFLHTSYSDSLATNNSAQTKSIILHEKFQARWPIYLKKDASGKKMWETEEDGGVYAVSMGGQITGFGAGGVGADFEGAVIIDDPMKPKDAESETMRAKINASFDDTIKSRLNNPEKTPIIVVMQRLHEDDFTGYLLGGNTEFDFTHISLPALNEDGSSEYDPRFEGEALWPTKHSEERLKLMKLKSLRIFSGQYQQTPAPKEGNIVKKKDIRYYTQIPIGGQDVQSWDFAFGGDEENDMVVGELWRGIGANHYILDMVRDNLTLPQSIVSMKNLTKRYPEALAKLIELKANGQAVKDSISSKISGIIGIIPTESKTQRFVAVSPMFEACNIWLPCPKTFPEHKWWVDIFVHELCAYPRAKNDDTVDACSQYLAKYGIIVGDDFDKEYDNTNGTIASNLPNW